jgi:hypothetical protein
MTTIAANLKAMAADRFVTYAPSYNGSSKLWIAKGAVWGAAGNVGHISAFKAWTMGKGKRPVVVDPEDTDAARLEILQLSPEGLFLWVNDDAPDAVKEPFYAIGSGAGYAIGALSMQSSLEQAVEVAAKWDSGTRLPFDMISLGSLKRKPKPAKGDTGWRKAMGDD